MLIKRTTPAESFCDSYMVEIQTSTCKGDLDSYLTIGPFKRVPHQRNLKHLLETLKRIKEDGDNETYHWTLGFPQWFSPEVESLDDIGHSRAADFYSEEDQEEAFTLSRGFTKDWPTEPNTADTYYLQLQGFKVFYYDYNGIKYNTEVTL